MLIEIVCDNPGNPDNNSYISTGSGGFYFVYRSNVT